MMEILQYAYVIALLAALGYGFYRAVIWAERDALLRGKSPLFVKCAVILFFPWGLIAWLLFRPDPVDGANPRAGEFNLNDFRQQ